MQHVTSLSLHMSPFTECNNIKSLLWPGTNVLMKTIYSPLALISGFLSLLADKIDVSPERPEKNDTEIYQQFASIT